MSNDHAYELRELMENLTKAYEVVGKVVREEMAALFGLRPAAEPEPDGFEHTDNDGDSVAVRQGALLGFVYVDVNNDVARLDQSAVNRLAQYLDRHRTDLVDNDSVPCWTNPIKGECPACGHASHGSVGCSERQLRENGPYRCLCRGGSDGA